MNIILTGHKGLIGSSLEKRLTKEKHNIVVGIDIRDGKNIIGMKDLTLKNLKISNPVDMLIHCAAQCKINEAITNPELPNLNDAQGTFEVLEFCRKNGIKKIINFSSSRVLSKEKNSYTAAKIYGEELCKGYHDCYEIEYITIRPSTVYGPFWDLTKRLMHIFITNALQGKDLEIYGDPNTKTLDFTYIDDFIDGIILAIHGPWNKEYNISGGENYNIYNLAKFIIKNTNIDNSDNYSTNSQNSLMDNSEKRILTNRIIHSKSKIVLKEAEMAQPQKIKLDASEIQKIGYLPKINVEEGVKRCIDFYKKYMKEKGMI